MTENNLTPRQRLMAIGGNIDAVGLYAVITLIVAGMIIGAMWSAYYWAPFGVLEGGQPIREQVPLDIMPALPQALEDAYDAHTTAEITRVESYEVVDDEAGLARIPVSEAQAMMLAEGMFPVRGEETAEESSAEGMVDDAETEDDPAEAAADDADEAAEEETDASDG